MYYGEAWRIDTYFFICTIFIFKVSILNMLIDEDNKPSDIEAKIEQAFVFFTL